MYVGSRLKRAWKSGRRHLKSLPSSRTGENPPYGMIGGVEETSVSFEARSAPRSYPTVSAQFRMEFGSNRSEEVCATVLGEAADQKHLISHCQAGCDVLWKYDTGSRPCKRYDFLIIGCAYNGGYSWIVLACIVKNTFNRMASIKRYNDDSRTGDAGGFQNPFPATVPEDHLVSRLFCPAKAYQVGFDRNVKSVCGLKHERPQAAPASTTTQDYVIPEILIFLAYSGFFGIGFDAM